MAQYELMVIYVPDLDEEALNGVKERLRHVIRENGGELGETNDMGRRRLAYDIAGYREGIYEVINFDADGDAVVNELDRVIKIDDRCIRHLIVNMTKDRNE